MTNFKQNQAGPGKPNNKSRSRRHSAPTLGDYMGRLPLHQQLNTSQHLLVKLSPVWHSWLNDNLSSLLSKSAVLSHYADGQLLISCDNAVIASQVKHLQNSLINYLNQTGFKEIQTISIRIEQPNHARAEDRSANTINQGIPFCQPSSNSIKSISYCHQTVNSESLSAALKRLEKTLKNS